MGATTGISWTDSTHNFWRGCTKVSPGCARCYAETLVTTRLKGEWGKGKPRVRSQNFDAPLAWNKRPWVCDRCGEAVVHNQMGLCSCVTASSVHRRRVFSLSLGDILDPEAPIAYLADALDVIRRCRNLVFQLLTKRPNLFFDRLVEAGRYLNGTDTNHVRNGETADFVEGWIQNQPPENVWIGTSVEDQQRADERVPELLKIPARVRFLSVEPMLGPIEFSDVSKRSDAVKQPGKQALDGIAWTIIGGESGPGARPCSVEWIRSVVEQCKAAQVSCFVKQLGSMPMAVPPPPPGGRYVLEKPGQLWKMLLRDKKGGDIAEFPSDLRVREFPALQPA
jgi:protein gp37